MAEAETAKIAKTGLLDPLVPYRAFTSHNADELNVWRQLLTRYRNDVKIVPFPWPPSSWPSSSSTTSSSTSIVVAMIPRCLYLVCVSLADLTSPKNAGDVAKLLDHARTIAYALDATTQTWFFRSERTRTWLRLGVSYPPHLATWNQATYVSLRSGDDDKDMEATLSCLETSLLHTFIKS